MQTWAAAVASGLIVLCADAIADPEDSWNLVVGAQAQRDDNLFRRPAAQAQSEQITATSLGLKINKPYSLQRFILDSSLVDYRFDTNKQLNHVANTTTAMWLWSITPRFHGTLMAWHNKSLNNFVDYQGVQRNMRTMDSYRFDSEWEAWGPIRIVAGVNRFKLQNGQQVNGESNYQANSGEYGIKYQFPSESNIALVSMHTKGEYLNRVLDPISLSDTGFKENALEARGVWLASGKTTVNAKLGHLEREHDNFDQRNYHGTTGSLELLMMPLGKLKIKTGWRQELVSYQSTESSYYRKQVLDINSAWQLSQKLTLRGIYSDETRDFLGALQASLAGREDRLKNASLILEWMPLRTTTFSATYSDQTRSSNRTGLDFTAHVYNLSANLAF